MTMQNRQKSNAKKKRSKKCPYSISLTHGLIEVKFYKVLAYALIYDNLSSQPHLDHRDCYVLYTSGNFSILTSLRVLPAKIKKSCYCVPLFLKQHKAILRTCIWYGWNLLSFFNIFPLVLHTQNVYNSHKMQFENATFSFKDTGR